MYEQDIQGRCGEEIDSGFGLSSSGRMGTALFFTDVGQNEDVDEVPMEVRTSWVEQMDTGARSA